MTLGEKAMNLISDASFFVGYTRGVAGGRVEGIGADTVAKADAWTAAARELLHELARHPYESSTDEGSVDPITGMNTSELSGAYRTAQATIDRIEVCLRQRMPELVEVQLVEDLLEHAISRMGAGEPN